MYVGVNYTVFSIFCRLKLGRRLTKWTLQRKSEKLNMMHIYRSQKHTNKYAWAISKSAARPTGMQSCNKRGLQSC